MKKVLNFKQVYNSEIIKMVPTTMFLWFYLQLCTMIWNWNGYQILQENFQMHPLLTTSTPNQRIDLRYFTQERTLVQRPVHFLGLKAMSFWTLFVKGPKWSPFSSIIMFVNRSTCCIPVYFRNTPFIQFTKLLWFRFIQNEWRGGIFAFICLLSSEQHRCMLLHKFTAITKYTVQIMVNGANFKLVME